MIVLIPTVCTYPEVVPTVLSEYTLVSTGYVGTFMLLVSLGVPFYSTYKYTHCFNIAAGATCCPNRSAL